MLLHLEARASLSNTHRDNKTKDKNYSRRPIMRAHSTTSSTPLSHHNHANDKAWPSPSHIISMYQVEGSHKALRNLGIEHSGGRHHGASLTIRKTGLQLGLVVVHCVKRTRNVLQEDIAIQQIVLRNEQLDKEISFQMSESVTNELGYLGIRN